MLRTARLKRLRKNADSSLSSPRKRGSGQLGMTRIKDLAARLKAAPLQNKGGIGVFPQPVKPRPFKAGYSNYGTALSWLLRFGSEDATRQPHWSYEDVNGIGEKGGLVALDKMAEPRQSERRWNE